jgi:branched-chain amino acid transport system substrate-binding protein
MARYKYIDASPRFLPVDLSRQLLPGSFEYALNRNYFPIDARTPFYWNTNDETRKWSERYFKKMGKMPSSIQAADYSSTMPYLKAVQAAGTDNAEAVIKKMKEMPVNDFYAKGARIRSDGLPEHDFYLMEVKKPAESKRAWDYYHIPAVVPGSEAYPPLSASTRKLAK